MRLAMTLPEGWATVPATAADLLPLASLRALPETSIIVVAAAAEPRLRIVYGPLVPVPLPGEGESFINRVLQDGVGVERGERLVVKRRGPNQTVTGYPMLLVHSTIENSAGAIVEARLTAFYNLLSVNAVAVLRVRGSDGETDNIGDIFARYEEPGKTILRTATPDWETGLCTIAAFYEGLPNLWERK